MKFKFDIRIISSDITPEIIEHLEIKEFADLRENIQVRMIGDYNLIASNGWLFEIHVSNRKDPIIWEYLKYYKDKSYEVTQMKHFDRLTIEDNTVIYTLTVRELVIDVLTDLIAYQHFKLDELKSDQAENFRTIKAEIERLEKILQD